MSFLLGSSPCTLTPTAAFCTCLRFYSDTYDYNLFSCISGFLIDRLWTTWEEWLFCLPPPTPALSSILYGAWYRVTDFNWIHVVFFDSLKIVIVLKQGNGTFHKVLESFRVLLNEMAPWSSRGCGASIKKSSIFLPTNIIHIDNRIIVIPI